MSCGCLKGLGCLGDLVCLRGLVGTGVLGDTCDLGYLSGLVGLFDLIDLCNRMLSDSHNLLHAPCCMLHVALCVMTRLVRLEWITTHLLCCLSAGGLDPSEVSSSKSPGL